MELIRLVMVATALLFVSGCDLIGGSGKSDSGIAGDGVITAGILSKVGDGSSKGWSSNCQLVEGKTQWRWGWWQDGADANWEPELSDSVNPSYIFTIDKPGLMGEVWGQDQKFITLLKQSQCKIDYSTKIAYTTKDWLCAGDMVKVGGEDCIISTIE